MFKTSKKALISFFAYEYNNYKKIIITGIAVCAGIYILQLALAIILSQTKSDGSNINSGMLISGTISLLLAFMIGIFINTADGKIKNTFRFPINRPTYALGILLCVLLAPLAIIAVSSVFFVLETLTYKLLSMIIGNVIYINTVTVASYLEGIIPTYATIVFAMSLTYMLSMYFHRYKLQFALALALIVFAIISFSGFRAGFVKAFIYGFNIKSMLSFTLYMISISIGAHILAFIPLKIMEVK